MNDLNKYVKKCQVKGEGEDARILCEITFV